ncbi:MAG: hypothetical protein R3B49_02495 [Phycisphaerales bacterium]
MSHRGRSRDGVTSRGEGGTRAIPATEWPEGGGDEHRALGINLSGDHLMTTGDRAGSC